MDNRRKEAEYIEDIPVKIQNKHVVRLQDTCKSQIQLLPISTKNFLSGTWLIEHIKMRIGNESKIMFTKENLYYGTLISIY
jgi:hypothetical protein